MSFYSTFLIYYSIDLLNSFLKVLITEEDYFYFILSILNSIINVIYKVEFKLIKDFISKISNSKHYLYLSYIELKYIKVYIYITLSQEGPKLTLVSMIDIRNIDLKEGIVCVSNISLRVVRPECN
jgi:hypothetical protein